MSKAVLLFSGGLDSTVLLWSLMKKYGNDVSALSVRYGQRHSRELDHARMIAKKAGVNRYELDLSSLRGIFKGSALTDDVPVPEGHYADESMKLTVVPNRNMILLALGAAFAESEGANVLYYAAHSGGDNPIYPDCRPQFIAAMGTALQWASWNPVMLRAPFADMLKPDIVLLGHDLGAPMEDTWSCYQGGAIHCGRCGTCQKRREAFVTAGVADLVRYES